MESSRVNSQNALNELYNIFREQQSNVQDHPEIKKSQENLKTMDLSGQKPSTAQKTKEEWIKQELLKMYDGKAFYVFDKG